MNKQTPYSKENEYKNNSEHSANRALPPSGEPEGAPVTSFISHSLSLPLQNVSAVLTLLNEGCTIPFISRYRKERTGGLDEVQITDISELYDRLKELNKRKETILKTIREQEKLTPELEARIRACMDSTELEDIYLPYKPKRRTRAQIAREQGLEPLALAIMEEAKNSTAPSNSPEGGRVQRTSRRHHQNLMIAEMQLPSLRRGRGRLYPTLNAKSNRRRFVRLSVLWKSRRLR